MSTKKLASFFIMWVTIITVVSAQQSYKDIAAASKVTLFNESFDNNNNGWLLDNLYIKANITNGQYDMVCNNYHNSTGLSGKIISIDQGKDYEIEASIKTLRGNGGLVFGMNNNFDHYRIELTKNNTLVLLKNTISNGRNEELFSSPINSNIKAGSFNKITLRKLKDTYYIYLDETFIGSTSKIKPPGDQVGFNVGINSEISVDYLNISYLANQTSPVTTEKPPVKTDTEKSDQANVPATITLEKRTSNPSAQIETNAIKKSYSPLITWVSPSAATTRLDNYTARVKANIKSGSELKSALFYVNGSSKGDGEMKTVPGNDGMYLAEKTITLEPGENNVYLVATNNEGTSKSDLRYFNNPQANPPEIAWGIPLTASAIVSTETFTMEVCIKSPADLISAKVLVDGVQVTVGKVFQRLDATNCNYVWKPQIILKEGDNSIYVIAENAAGSATSENRIIKFSKVISEKRLALVIGNSGYQGGASLKNPVNDANLMEATLKDLGFEVIKRLNSGKDDMLNSIREFSRKLSNYNVALFYYAGHGIQVEGVNYLIPTNAKLENKDDCKWEAIAVSTVTDEFKKNSVNTNIVILDACRNNPYRSWARGGEPGFKALAPIIGTIISFSTSEGSTAADGDGANGVFTEELVKQMEIPQQIESVFKKTRKQVIERTNGLQTPTEWSYLTGDFYFRKQ
jgi:Caspase domain